MSKSEKENLKAQYIHMATSMPKILDPKNIWKMEIKKKNHPIYFYVHVSGHLYTSKMYNRYGKSYKKWHVLVR